MRTTLEAISAIVLAGKGAEARELIDKAASGAKFAYDDVRAQTDYTTEARSKRIADLYEGRREALDRELQALASRVGGNDRDDVAWTFGTAGLPGDPASLVISMRDAQDRVAQMDSRDELLSLVQRATRNGDEVLARAVAQRAMELRYDTVLHEFCETRPALDAAVERIWKAQRREFNTFEWSVRLSALKPSEVR